MDAREFQKCVSKSFDFCKILKMRENKLSNQRTFCLVLSFIVHRKDAYRIQIEPH